MATEDFVIELFCRIDRAMGDVPKHSQANLYPSEVVTLGFLFAIKGVQELAFYRGLKRDWRHLSPRLPEPTRLFRLFKRYQKWTTRFLANPTLLGVADIYGIELRYVPYHGVAPHARRAQRPTDRQKKGSRIAAGS